jgi:protein disulfide-isomerase
MNRRKQIKKRKPSKSIKNIIIKKGGAKNLKMSENQKNPDFILFYAPWCHFCQQFKERLNKIKNKCNSTIKMVNCDLQKNSKLVNENNIQGIPSLRNKNMTEIMIPNSDKDLIKLFTI